jgi:uncharacterized protein
MASEIAAKVDINVPIVMRDGTVLRGDVYRPDTQDKYPALLMRTPYDKLAARNLIYEDPLRPVRNGYAVVLQDIRGAGASDGTWLPFEGEADDGYDTIEWIARQPWSNGKVGMYGLSYPGTVQWPAACEQPPHLTAIFPAMTGCSARDFLFGGGVFQLQLAQLWSFAISPVKLLRSGVDLTTLLKTADRILNSVDNFWEEASYLPLNGWPHAKETGLVDFYLDIVEHLEDNDFWEKFIKISYEKINVPVYMMTSWYDINNIGHGRDAIACYNNIVKRAGTEDARKHSKLIVGPWIHELPLYQSAGDLDFGIRAAGTTFDIMGIELQWFDYWMKGVNNSIINQPPIRLFVMGDNVWRHENEWPLQRTKYVDYYFHSRGAANTLDGDGVLNTQHPEEEKADAFKYDPHDPVPTVGGSAFNVARICGPMDQRDIERRQDILVYTTPPLKEDIEVTGPVSAIIFASSSAKDTDFTGKLVDVWPDGKAIILTEGIVRARYRDSELIPSLIEPGKAYRYTIDLNATSNVFKAGHCIRIEISSSNFPRYDRNLNTGNPIGKDDKIEIANQRVFHDGQRPSHVTLPVIPR